MNKNNKILVSAYLDPDLDGTACAIAYAEYLQKQGENAIAALFGEPHQEAQFVFKTFSIPIPQQAEKILTADIPIVMVDTSEIAGLAKEINIEQIIEIIDHRKVNDADKFVNAKVQIELVGSAATLIAEKFIENKTAISAESAVLLYSAIISNTINFQANVTTDRDKLAAEWLKTKFREPVDYIRTMFTTKSQFTKSLKETIEHDFANFTFGNKTVGIAQLEIVDVEEFIAKNTPELVEILHEIKDQNNYDYIFLTTIDVLKATNTFLIIDEKSKSLLEKALKISFHDNIAIRQGIMMRKTITPLVKQILEN